MPEVDFFFFLKLHGLKVCPRKVVISNACFFGDGVDRADSKAVVSAEGSRWTPSGGMRSAKVGGGTQ